MDEFNSWLLGRLEAADVAAEQTLDDLTDAADPSLTAWHQAGLTMALRCEDPRFPPAVAAALDRAIAVQRVEALGPFPGYLADACARQAEQTAGGDSAAWYRRAWWLQVRKTRYLELQLGLRGQPTGDLRSYAPR